MKPFKNLILVIIFISLFLIKVSASELNLDSIISEEVERAIVTNKFFPKEVFDAANNVEVYIYNQKDSYYWDYYDNDFKYGLNFYWSLDDNISHLYYMYRVGFQDEKISKIQYTNAGIGFYDPINKISEKEAYEKVVSFFEVFNLNNEVLEYLKNGSNKDKINIIKKDLNPNSTTYKVMRYEIYIYGIKKYVFEVDLNMGAIIIFYTCINKDFCTIYYIEPAG